MTKILFVVQLPPPIHGVALMNELVVKSPLTKQHFTSHSINIGTADLKDIGKFSAGKIFHSLRHMMLILKQLVFFRPRLVYLTLSPTGFAFYRDALYIGLIRCSRARLVIHLHGQGIKAGAANSRLFRWVCKRIFRKSFVIFLSERLKEDAIAFVRQPYFVVNNGIPESTPPPARPANIPGQPAPPTPPVNILYLSNFVRTKGILDLLEALAIVARTRHDFHLTLVGKPFDITVGLLADQVREKALTGLVTIDGPRYKEEKKTLLEQADIFVLPSYNEAFPLAILEAMQYGLPVISTYEGGIPDIIDDRINGLLFAKRDIPDLAEKIIFLLDHPEERARLGNAARRKFLEKFTVNTFEKNIQEVLLEIAGPRS